MQRRSNGATLRMVIGMRDHDDMAKAQIEIFNRKI